MIYLVGEIPLEERSLFDGGVYDVVDVLHSSLLFADADIWPFRCLNHEA